MKRSYMRIFLAKIMVLTIFATLGVPAHAGDTQEKASHEKKQEDMSSPRTFVTKHRQQIGGKQVSFTATASETHIENDKGQEIASIFSVAYVKDGALDPKRPVTFLYNGGPGSASLWLHMGAFGPKRVAIPSDAKDDGAPPYPIVDNPDSLLDVTDLVFIDPVGTGFSTSLGKSDEKDFWGIRQDAQSVANFIRKWLRENGRWNSPKFIGGESYGTTRSAVLMDELEGGFNDVSVNGVILISAILDFGARAEVQGNEIQYVLTLPTMAATAWYHKVLPNPTSTVEEIVERARAFALGPYASALIEGVNLPYKERAQIRSQIAQLTGLSEEYLENADLRVSPSRFQKELLRRQGKTIGRLDSRYVGVDFDRLGEYPESDPSFYGIDGGYTAAANAYIRDVLKANMGKEYNVIGHVSSWNWELEKGGRNYYLNVAPYLSRALRQNSDLRIFVAQGFYDFATPFLGSEYSLSRKGFMKDRIDFHYYKSGHMMYVKDSDRQKLSRDIRLFIRNQI